MEIIVKINVIIGLIFTICYAYQFFYIPIPWLFKRKYKREAQKNNLAVLICGRNESAVIEDLLDSISEQTYDQSLITVFVMADNCTDNTADIARRHGAVVYERFNKTLIGKGYALTELLGHIKEDFPEGFDGYFVFDADNILSKDYIEKMNLCFSQGHDILTSYRNSKNYGDNWISAGYALWFLRESRYLNQARYTLHTSCAVSGTGFMFSRKIFEEVSEWPFHMLTEDIEFSVYNITKGRKIAFCKEAELYDEQPVKFSQSWRQRLRWSKGYYQVFGGYGGKLIKGIFKGNFSCYDMCMTIMPAFVLSLFTVGFNLWAIANSIITGQNIREVLAAVWGLITAVYGTTFFVGVITTITEWKHIHTSTFKKILYCFTFPLFLFTYIPISVHALFSKGSWKPIEHTKSMKKVGDVQKKAERKSGGIRWGLIGAVAAVVIALIAINVYVSTRYSKHIISEAQAAELDDIDYIVVFTRESGDTEISEQIVQERVAAGSKLAAGVSQKPLLVVDDRTAVTKNKNELNVKNVVGEDVSYLEDAEAESFYESMRRLKEIHGVKRIVIVTQKCHMARALYVANELGIEAYGVSVDGEVYDGQFLRDCGEALAKIRDFTLTVFDVPEDSNTKTSNSSKPTSSVRPVFSDRV